ncbi:MAG: TonB-dependent receptor plug domain-containing protein [Odoribacter sp.]|nr:TonB-dependent receptor plug domain-containing protein [Odoribacter sp.]
MNRCTGAIIALLVATTMASAAGDSSRQLNEVVVWARRPMKDIGVTKTTIDSAMLKENTSLSMADVLAFNSSVYIKSYGRSTLSTVAFRGTSPGHTKVTWNGLSLNSPMLGATDLSTIPAYFVDKASLFHGSTSINETGGGLGGLISLATIPEIEPGVMVRYVQGIGSFSTFDEFLHISWGNNQWHISTRASFSSSPNDFKYVNHDKKENVYDDDHNIIAQYHPVERNRNGAFKDFNLLQEIYLTTHSKGTFSANAWYSSFDRQIPMLSTSYAENHSYENRQREQTVRGVAGWERFTGPWRMKARAGYVHTWMAYDYSISTANQPMRKMSQSRSKVNTFYGQFEAELQASRKWFFSASASMYYNRANTLDITSTFVGGEPVGYDRGRTEFSGVLSAKWQPISPLGISAVVRQESAGSSVPAPVPAIFVDFLLSRRGNLMLKASGSRNYKAPTLNDLYFLPGGNPDLRSESGWSYDAAISCNFGRPGTFSAGASATWFDSYINDWILWLPTAKGFFSPRNIRRVHAYGVEIKGNAAIIPHSGWVIDLNASYSWTPSINLGDRISQADRSRGAQLPYTPRHSASFTTSVTWHSWSFIYKWCFYSRRFTMTSNESAVSGSLEPYFMSNVALEKSFRLKRGLLAAKIAVNNIFNADYITVLSRPMPGINAEFFISYTFK